MKSLTFWHTVFLIFSILLTWLWSTNQGLTNYNLQLTGALILVYFVFKIIPRSVGSKNSDFPPTLILNTICLLLVFSTGGLASPLFFTLNFLIFALALLSEPKQAAIASILLVSLFAWQGRDSMDTLKIVNLLSLILMTPLAMIFSRNYLEILADRGTIKILEKNLQETETDSLLWISTEAKPSLINVLDTLNSITDPLPNTIMNKLKTIQKDIIALYSSANNLEKSIEDTSNKIDL